MSRRPALCSLSVKKSIPHGFYPRLNVYLPRPLSLCQTHKMVKKNYFLCLLLMEKKFLSQYYKLKLILFIFFLFYVICLKNLSHSILFFYFSYWHWCILFFIFPFHFSELDDDENQKDTVRNRSMGSIETDFTSVTQLK